MSVDLPEPVEPMKAVVSPALALKEMFWRTLDSAPA